MLGSADAQAATRNKPKVVKAVASAPAAGAVASATASCPQRLGSKGPWRALSGGFVVQQGDGIVHESRRVGQRSWRASAQSFSGLVSLAAYVNCQRGRAQGQSRQLHRPHPGRLPDRPRGDGEVHPGSAVAGGFSTPPPFTGDGRRQHRDRLVPQRQASLEGAGPLEPGRQPHQLRLLRQEGLQAEDEARQGRVDQRRDSTAARSALSTTGLLPRREASAPVVAGSSSLARPRRST